MTLKEAAERKIRRLRSSQHGDACYIRLDLIERDATFGPWLRFFNPGCTVLELEYKNPVLCILDLGVSPDSWEEFKGPRSVFDLDDMPNYIPLSE